MTTLYVLDTPENVSVARVAARDSDTTVHRVGPYFEIRKDGEIVIDRRATGCRHAVWYSCIGGLSGGVCTQHDKDAMRISPR